MIAALAALALAQHAGHGMPGMAMPPAAQPPASAAPVAGCPPEHAAMGHCAPSPAPPQPATSRPIPVVVVPVVLGTDLPAGDGPPPPAPPVDAADRVYGADAMRVTRRAMYREHGGGRFSQVMVNLAEVAVRGGRDGYRWDADGWFGGDRDRLVIKSEGEGDFGEAADRAEIQALYSRAIGPYFNLNAGVRHDVTPNPSRTHAVVGIEGLAPYWFDVEAQLFVSDRGDVTGRAEASYDQRITQRLILQPRAELNASAQAIPGLGIGSGITDVELGLRLRYEVVREFAPYIGLNWQRRLGGSARAARASGDGASDLHLVAGLRTWF